MTQKMEKVLRNSQMDHSIQEILKEGSFRGRGGTNGKMGNFTRAAGEREKGMALEYGIVQMEIATKVSGD